MSDSLLGPCPVVADLPVDVLSNIEVLIQPLAAYIEGTWDTSSMLPKGYKESYLQYVERFVTEEEIQEELAPILKGFCGVNDETATELSFAEKCARPRVIAEAVGFQKRPIETLLEAAVIFGMRIETARRKHKLAEAKKQLGKAFTATRILADKGAEIERPAGEPLPKVCTPIGALDTLEPTAQWILDRIVAP